MDKGVIPKSEVSRPIDPPVYSETFGDPRYPGRAFEEGYIYAIEWPVDWFDAALAGRAAQVEYYQEGANTPFKPGVRFRGQYRPLTDRELRECLVSGLLWADRGFGPSQESVCRTGWDATLEKKIQQKPATCATEVLRELTVLVNNKTIEVVKE